MAQQALQRFLARLDGTGPLWKSLDVRSVAVRADGAWWSLATVVRLSTSSRKRLEGARHLPTLDALKVVQVRYHFGELQRLIDGYLSGELRLGRTRIRYRPRPAPGAPTSDPTSDFTFSHRDRGMARAPIAGWATYVLSASNDSVGNLLGRSAVDAEEIENVLRLGAQPYDGLADFSRHFFNSAEYLERSYNARFEVIAPLEGRLVSAESYLRDGVCQVIVDAGSEAVARQLDLGFSALGAKDASGRISLGDEDWQASGRPGMWRATVRRRMPRARSTNLMLRLGPQCIDRLALKELRAPDDNPRLLAYSTIDHGGAWLQKTLLPESNTSDGTGFEQAVARLFTLLGFQVDSFANQTKLNQGSDALAYDPFSAAALVIECTTSSLDSKGKLGKLVARTQALRENVPGRVWTPVLVSSIEIDAVAQAELAKAASDGVTVLTRLGLRNLFDRVGTDPTTADVLDWLQQERLSIHGRVLGSSRWNGL